MATEPATTRRQYVDRLGRVITDPEVIEARYMVTQLHRLATIGIKAGRHYEKTVTVRELAKASKLTVERVIAIVRRYSDGWLLYLIEDGPEQDWWVCQDGE